MKKHCYSPMPQKKYTLGVKKPKSLRGYCLGLGDPDCVGIRELWNLLAVTSKLLFKWEDSSIKMKDKPASFPQLEEAKTDLGKKLDGVGIDTLLRTHNVYEFCNLMLKSDLSHLCLCKFFRGQDQLKMVMKARLAAYKQSKGKPVSKREHAILQMVKRQI